MSLADEIMQPHPPKRLKLHAPSGFCCADGHQGSLSSNNSEDASAEEQEKEALDGCARTCGDGPVRFSSIGDSKESGESTSNLSDSDTRSMIESHPDPGELENDFGQNLDVTRDRTHLIAAQVCSKANNINLKHVSVRGTLKFRTRSSENAKTIISEILENGWEAIPLHREFPKRGSEDERNEIPHEEIKGNGRDQIPCVQNHGESASEDEIPENCDYDADDDYNSTGPSDSESPCSSPSSESSAGYVSLVFSGTVSPWENDSD